MAVQRLAGRPYRESAIVRILIREGLERRGLWPLVEGERQAGAGGSLTCPSRAKEKDDG